MPRVKGSRDESEERTTRHRPVAAEESSAEEGAAAAAEGAEEAPGDDENVEVEVEDEIDARPTHDIVEEDQRGSPVEESGLSVDPEDLGRQWLNQATEQNNFESSGPDGDSGLHVFRLPVKQPPF